MKKGILLLQAAVIIALISLSASCLSFGYTPEPSLDYAQPAFDKPFSYVIDSRLASGDMEDNVILINKSSDSNIEFNVYVNIPQTQSWEFFGNNVLENVDDSNGIDSSYEDIESYRYFAIESMNGKNYKYLISKAHNDLIVTITDGVNSGSNVQAVPQNTVKAAPGLLTGKRIAIVGIDSVTKSVSKETLDALVLFVENAFVHSGQVTVVDRKSIDKIIQEYNFQTTGLTDEATAVQIGKIAGAEAIVSGTLSSVGSKYYLQLRLIDVKTAEVIASSLDQAAGENDFLKMSNGAVQQLF